MSHVGLATTGPAANADSADPTGGASYSGHATTGAMVTTEAPGAASADGSGRFARWWQASGTLERRPWATAMGVLALAGLVIALYLEVTRLAGGLPVCGPSGGCETVALSPYSVVLGIPVSAFGVLYSIVLLVVLAAWWRDGDRRLLYAAYGMGLIACFFEVYLVYLELFVIHAICVWCAGYGVTVVGGWLLAVAAARRFGRQPA